MNIGPRTRQHDAVDHIEQGRDVGDVRATRKHQGQGAGHFSDGAKVSFANRLDLKTTFDAMGIPDHTNNRLPSHAPSISRTLRKGDNALAPAPDQQFSIIFPGGPALRWIHSSRAKTGSRQAYAQPIGSHLASLGLIRRRF
jgi:hypothetical protein